MKVYSSAEGAIMVVFVCATILAFKFSDEIMCHLGNMYKCQEIERQNVHIKE